MSSGQLLIDWHQRKNEGEKRRRREGGKRNVLYAICDMRCIPLVESVTVREIRGKKSVRSLVLVPWSLIPGLWSRELDLSSFYSNLLCSFDNHEFDILIFKFSNC
jgi:hypothetical protein